MMLLLSAGDEGDGDDVSTKNTKSYCLPRVARKMEGKKVKERLFLESLRVQCAYEWCYLHKGTQSVYAHCNYTEMCIAGV